MNEGMMVSIVFNIVTVIIILFLMPKAGKIDDILRELHKLDKKIKSDSEIKGLMKLEIAEHMEKYKHCKRKDD